MTTDEIPDAHSLAECEPSAMKPGTCWTHEAPWDTCPFFLRIANALATARELGRAEARS